jgi:hypothetical protein
MAKSQEKSQRRDLNFAISPQDSTCLDDPTPGCNRGAFETKKGFSPIFRSEAFTKQIQHSQPPILTGGHRAAIPERSGSGTASC